MKKSIIYSIITSCLLALAISTHAQVKIGDNSTIVDARAILEMETNNKALYLPRLTTTQRNTQTGWKSGMMIYNNTDSCIQFFDGLAWNKLKPTPSTAPGTLDGAYDFGGAGNGRTITATDGAVKINGEDGFVVIGSINQGNEISAELNLIESSSRMFFNPRKGAFRAGFYSPDDSVIFTNGSFYTVPIPESIGKYSFAGGNSTIARGTNSTAFGWLTRASGTNSVAMGAYSNAPSENSTALGYATQANGENAFSAGTFAYANGNYSVSIGNNTESNGNNAISFGYRTEAASYVETVMGHLNTTYTPLSATSYNPADRLFVVGNGTAYNARSDAFTILKNGKTGIATSTPEFRLHILSKGGNGSYKDGILVDNPLAGGEAAISFRNGDIPTAKNWIWGLNQSSSMTLAYGDGFNQNTTRMFIDTTGNVGIGPGFITPAFRLQISTNSAAKPTSNTWTVPSDARLKTNVTAFNVGLDAIQKIHPVTYTYTGKAGMPRETGIGVIAQELKEVAPYMVGDWTYTDPETGAKENYLSVDNGAMTYMLINAIKEQQKQIETLEAKLKEATNNKNIVANGTMRYNETMELMEYFNGKEWVKMNSQTTLEAFVK